MESLLGALVLVLLGLLGARLSFRTTRAPLGPRLFLSTGTHFLFLGILLGSHGLGLLSREIIGQLQPFLALGLGWIGLLFGLQLDRRHLAPFPRRYLGIAFGQAAVVFGLFFTVAAPLLDATDALAPGTRGALLATAATASISTPAGIALISHTFLVRGRVSQLLFFISSLDGVIGVLALQLAYARYHPLALSTGTGLGVGAWLALSLALGLVSGIFFLWFTRPKPGREELMLFLLGIVVFTAGIGLYLGLSPLFLSMMTGAVVANLSPLRRRVYAALQAWEQPIYVILLVLAGALFEFPSWLVLPLAAGYVVIRIFGKLAGAAIVTRVLPVGFHVPADLGIGLVAQGGISLAMAISIALTYGSIGAASGGGVAALFAAIVLGVVVNELVGPFLTRNLLRRAGEIEPRIESALAAGELRGDDEGPPAPGPTGLPRASRSRRGTS
ncbi:MAG TPA: cation:proton antiporter [Longimicrobiales bacterium]